MILRTRVLSWSVLLGWLILKGFPYSWGYRGLEESDRNSTCPWGNAGRDSRSWTGSFRSCYECRICPFLEYACCETDTELQIEKALQVYGSTYWDCRITLLRFMECGKCSPLAAQFLQNKTEGPLFAQEPSTLPWSIRICKQACSYIYKRCKSVKVNGLNLITEESSDAFCASSPDEGSGTICFNNAPKPLPPISLLLFFFFFFLFFFF